MNIQPTFNYTQEFAFAENTNSKGCCCCWKSKTSKPKEYYVNHDGSLERFNSNGEKFEARIKSNKRLARLISFKFNDDPIENNLAFERLKRKVNHDFDNGDKITDKKLMRIVNAIYEVKREIQESNE